jgi:hypothetical protein
MRTQTTTSGIGSTQRNSSGRRTLEPNEQGNKVTDMDATLTNNIYATNQTEYVLAKK